MLLEPHTFAFADGRGALRPYVAFACSVRNVAKGMTGVQGPQTDWSALMLTVRDAGDRAAFAQLFRHFAPRVKSYLMKSGASGLAGTRSMMAR